MGLIVDFQGRGWLPGVPQHDIEQVLFVDFQTQARPPQFAYEDLAAAWELT